MEQNTRPFIEDNGALARTLVGIMDKATAFVRHFDTQTNTLVALSSALFVFSMNSAAQHEKFMVPLFILGIFSGIAAIAGLYAIHPPRFMRKQRQMESLMYNKKVTAFPSHEEYAQALKEMLSDRDEIIKQHALETYNLYKYYYRPKRDLFTHARNALMIGITFSLLVFIYTNLR